MFERCTVYLHRTFKDLARCDRTRVERNPPVPVSKRGFFFFSLKEQLRIPLSLYLCLPNELTEPLQLALLILASPADVCIGNHENYNCHGQRINFKRNLGIVIGLLKTEPYMSAPHRNNLQRIEQIQIAYDVHVEQTIV